MLAYVLLHCGVPSLAVIMSDTLIGDPLLQAPLWIQNEDVTRSLCYEVHGRSGAYFNLVSDECVLVNALYTAIGNDLNVVSEMGIDAVGEGEGACVAIKIRQENDTCRTSVILDGTELPVDVGEETEVHGVNVRQKNKYRVRVSVPNCDQVSLVMWATCEMIDGMAMMRFNISRGVNLRPTSHGLLGERLLRAWTIGAVMGHFFVMTSCFSFFKANSGTFRSKR